MPESLGVVGFGEPDRVRFVKGSTLIDVSNSGPRVDEEGFLSFARRLTEFPEGIAGELPVLVQHLPDFEKVSGTTSYAVQPARVQRRPGQGRF